MYIYLQDLCELQAETIFETTYSILKYRHIVQNWNLFQNLLDELKQHLYWNCTSKIAYYMPCSRLWTLFKLPLHMQKNKPSAILRKFLRIGNELLRVFMWIRDLSLPLVELDIKILAHSSENRTFSISNFSPTFTHLICSWGWGEPESERTNRMKFI